MSKNLFVDMGLVLGFFLLVLIAMAQMLLKKKDLKNYLIIASLLLIAIYQFSISFYLFSGLKNWYAIFPYIFITGRFSIFCSIPAAYIFFRVLPENKVVFTWKELLHFIIPVVALITLIVFAEFPIDQEGDPRHYKEFLNDNVPVFHLVSITSLITGIIYLSIIIRFYLKLHRKSKEERKKNLSVVIVLLVIVLTPLIVYIIYNNSIEALYDIIKLRFTIFAVYFFLLSHRYPFIANIIKLEAYREYYLKSSIESIEADKIIASLEELMDKEKLFTDNDLNLRKIAGRLRISPNKLSEILNTRQHKTFSIYVNEKRIVYARELLLSRPELTVLSIAMECGFNTISNFNTTFKKLAGVSPSEYRKKQALAAAE